MAYNPPIGSIYRLYTRYILPSTGIYNPYHLLLMLLTFQSLCKVPGYVARVDHSDSPVWRCPVHGWNLRLDDMTLPWWGWESIEKMHIDP